MKTPMTDDVDRFLDCKSVARLLDVSVKTIRNWIRTGRLPAYRLPNQRSLRVAYLDVIGVLKGSRRTSTDLHRKPPPA